MYSNFLIVRYLNFFWQWVYAKCEDQENLSLPLSQINQSRGDIMICYSIGGWTRLGLNAKLEEISRLIIKVFIIVYFFSFLIDNLNWFLFLSWKDDPLAASSTMWKNITEYDSNKLIHQLSAICSALRIAKGRN